ncbi:hypothetical protein ABIB85_004601 [Bradyrhizobium sp. JR1.5]
MRRPYVANVARVSEAIPGNAASQVPDVASLIRATGVRDE